MTIRAARRKCDEMKSGVFFSAPQRPDKSALLKILLFSLFFTVVPGAGVLYAQPAGTGEPAMAERYVLWAKDKIDNGLWGEALAGLERASDFAGVSSDISYLLALVRFHENMSRGSVLEALEKALAVDTWGLYGSEAARLLKAEILIALRAYPEALAELSRVSRSPEEAELTLKALVFFRPEEFRRYMANTLDRYPRECGPVRVFFSYLKNEDIAGRNPGREDLELLELVTRRLPVLLLKDEELAWMAAPFVRDRGDARRLVSAYRAVNEPVPSSLPISLWLGIIDDETAIEELFSAGGGKTPLDLDLLTEIWGLLRREETREIFRRNLSAYSGVITEDADWDGIPETFAEYREGILVSSSYDVNQDGVPNLAVYFEAGNPSRGQVLIPPDAVGQNSANAGRAAVQWERYPSLLEVELNGVRYVPRPLDFYYQPFRFIELWRSGIQFPQRDPLCPPLTRRVLVSHSLRVERPSLEFSGGREVVELNQGIPVRAREYVGELMVSETDFLRGRPQLQRVDLNLDGHIDTFRHFKRDFRQTELEELWDYDREIDYTVTIEE